MKYQDFQLLMIFWQLGLVDTFNVLKLCVNCGSQYMAVVASSTAGNFSELSVKSLLEPVLGFGTSYQFVQAAATTAERRKRIATLATFFSALVGALSTDPTTNGALGSAVASKIAYMKSILACKGGGSQIEQISTLNDFKPILIKTPFSKIDQYRIQFTENSRIMIDNLFHEHSTRHYLQGSIQKLKTISPTSIIPIASTQVNVTTFIGWMFFGITVISFTTLSVLSLFQRVERRRYQSKNVTSIIDTSVSFIDK